jgi:hypothetical protein
MSPTFGGKMFKKYIQFLISFLFFLALFFVFPVSADSECQGLSESSCKSNSDCTWVSGYSQKDGDKVKSYCRSIPGKGGDNDKKDKRKKNIDDDSDKKKKDKRKKDKDSNDDDDDKSKKKDKKRKKKDS